MKGKTINGFTLKHLLGTGGMAEVWYAENDIHKPAAVKILNENLSKNKQIEMRFRKEAEIMVALNHPNIRQVYGYGNIEDRPAIVMEYLDGWDLKSRMKKGRSFSQKELARWWNQMVEALKYTHALNIVHRDIKPSNIFIDKWGNAKLLDFGIAKVSDRSSGTKTGSALGTRIYMSPEQVKDPKRVGVASDVYSLAVTFTHLLTGKAPYDTATTSDYDIQVSIVTKPLDLSGVPDQWRVFLTPYLAKNPSDRPALRPYDLSAQSSDRSPDVDEETIDGEAFKDSSVFVGDGGSEEIAFRPKRKIWPWLLGVAAVIIAAVMLLLALGDKKPVSETIVDEPVADSVPIAPMKENETVSRVATLQFDYADWYGPTENGKPHGKGTFVFKKDGLYFGKEVSKGYRLEGSFDNGKLVVGRFYDIDNNLKYTVMP